MKKHYCHCGCGKKITIKPFHTYKGIPKYIKGHVFRLTGKNAINYGRKLDEQTIQKIVTARSWYKHSEITKNKISNVVKKTWKNDAKRKQEQVKRMIEHNPSKRADVVEKLRNANLGQNNPNYGTHMSAESNAKRRKSILRTFKENPEMFKRFLDYSNRKPNNYEKELNALLQAHWPSEWKFVGDGQFILGGRCPDFVNVNGKKLIIEFFGEHWHKPNDESKRQHFFEKYGFKTLIIWGKELRDEQLVIDKIKNFVK